MLTGDAGTMLVLADPRLAGMDFEINGVPAGEPGLFSVGPLNQHAMLTHQGGRRLMVSYWCAGCSIRTLTPGACTVCLRETSPDLKENLD
jgi:hypothetical protein